MSDNNILGLTFKLESTTNKKGEKVKGVSEADFSMQAKSIFSNVNLNVSNIFEELDTDGDKILTDKELQELTKYMDEIETDDEDTEDNDITSEIRNILNGVGDMYKKLNKVKELNIKDEDLKELTVSETQELLNLIAGAYADEPDKMTNDSLYTAIEKNVPKDVFEDAITGQNAGYWLKTYGAELMAESYNSKGGKQIDTEKIMPEANKNTSTKDDENITEAPIQNGGFDKQAKEIFINITNNKEKTNNTFKNKDFTDITKITIKENTPLQPKFVNRDGVNQKDLLQINIKDGILRPDKNDSKQAQISLPEDDLKPKKQNNFFDTTGFENAFNMDMNFSNNEEEA